MTAQIIVKNLHKYFGELEVLKGINLEINKGQVVCVIGPSGSGKSTFLRCINRLEEPTAGDIMVDDIMITDPGVDINKVRRRIGMVFQQFNLFPHLSAKQNIMMAPLELKLKTRN
ncbi:MAG: ATP-binding cassette domain-containing protein, partial [Syntrophomonas sp.]